jgi:hypothetical protein
MNNRAWGLVWAGLANVLGVLAFSRGFSNDYLSSLFPQLFSTWGLVCIQLWGLAYLSVSGSYRFCGPLLGVFAVEKAVYVGSWLWWQWHFGAQIGQIWATDRLTALFYTLYGPLDLVFGLYFAALLMRSRRD